MVRGAAVLPHSWQKGLRIAVFAEGEAADDARAAGGYSVPQAAPGCRLLLCFGLHAAGADSR
jgi:hypothetical protein